MQKAYMAYAIACALNKAPVAGSDDFKYDLYILFDDNPLEKTLEIVATAAGWTGNAPDLLKAGSNIVAKIGKTKFGSAVVSKLSAKISAKFAVKGASKLGATISAAAPFVGGFMAAAQASAFGAKALTYYMAK